MLHLIDLTRERLAGASDETRDRLALAAWDARERIVEATADTRLRIAELLELSRGRLAIVLGVLAVAAAGGFLVAGADGGETSSGAGLRDIASRAADPPAVGPTLVRERGFSLSLPDDWVRAEAPEGAVLAVRSADGSAQSTLWVERNRNLDFDGFIQQSLAGLTTLGEDARVTDRTDGPTIESSSAELRAEVALGGEPAGPYRVNLRAAGPYRYYLATSIQPGAAHSLLADAELIGSSLSPADPSR